MGLFERGLVFRKESIKKFRSDYFHHVDEVQGFDCELFGFLRVNKFLFISYNLRHRFRVKILPLIIVQEGALEEI